MDSIKDVVRSSVKVPNFDKHLKKAGGHISRNIVEITIKMKTIVRTHLMIKIIKLRLENPWSTSMLRSNVLNTNSLEDCKFEILSCFKIILCYTWNILCLCKIYIYTETVLSPWLAADEARVSHVLSHIVWWKKKEKKKKIWARPSG